MPTLRRLRTALAASLAAVLAVAGCGTRAQWQDGAAGPTASPTPPSFAGWSDPAGVGKPYGTKVNGPLTFRGSPTRTYYGTGPAPRTPGLRHMRVVPRRARLHHVVRQRTDRAAGRLRTRRAHAIDGDKYAFAVK